MSKENHTLLPWWGKIFIGGLVVLGLYKFTPLVEILTAALYTLLIPLFFLAGVGLISWGTLERFLGNVKTVKEKITEKRDEVVKDNTLYN